MSGHIGALDGLRALAVALVFAFHARVPGVPFWRAGYLGVDVFFVLSGFLITSLLIRERRRNGAVSLRRFYLRRALRLLPMVGVLLLIGFAVVVVSSPSYPERPEPIAFVAVATYWTNWLQIWRFGAAGMFGHTWSLAIEEQFYLAWPPIVAAVLAVGRFGARARLRIVLALALLGAGAVWANRVRVWAEAPAPVPPGAPSLYRFYNAQLLNRAFQHWYFGSFTRSSGLLVGAALAVVLSSARVRGALQRRRVPVLVIGCIAAVAAVAVVAFASRRAFQDFLPNWGLTVLEVSVAVVVAVVAVVPSRSVTWVLANPPIVWVGRRSYGIYLLHVPVLLLVHEALTSGRFGLAPNLLVEGMFGAALTLLAAAACHRYVEAPALRLKERVGGSVAAAT